MSWNKAEWTLLVMFRKEETLPRLGLALTEDDKDCNKCKNE